jgi:signal peptidase I
MNSRPLEFDPWEVMKMDRQSEEQIAQEAAVTEPIVQTAVETVQTAQGASATEPVADTAEIAGTTTQEASANRRKERRETLRLFLGFLIKLVLVGLAIWVIFTFVFGIGQIHGETMYPRLRDGDLILYYRLEQDYYIDDVVTFNYEGKQRTARIVAMEGDVVDLSADGQLLVNGNVQSEEVFYPTEAVPAGITYPYTVPEDSYFVLCDFRTASYDSRGYGAISRSELVGKVITLLRRRGI